MITFATALEQLSQGRPVTVDLTLPPTRVVQPGSSPPPGQYPDTTYPVFKPATPQAQPPSGRTTYPAGYGPDAPPPNVAPPYQTGSQPIPPQKGNRTLLITAILAVAGVLGLLIAAAILVIVFIVMPKTSLPLLVARLVPPWCWRSL